MSRQSRLRCPVRRRRVVGWQCGSQSGCWVGLTEEKTSTVLAHICEPRSASTSCRVTLSATLAIAAIFCFLVHQPGWLFSYVDRNSSGASIGLCTTVHMHALAEPLGITGASESSCLRTVQRGVEEQRARVRPTDNFHHVRRVSPRVISSVVSAVRAAVRRVGAPAIDGAARLLGQMVAGTLQIARVVIKPTRLRQVLGPAEPVMPLASHGCAAETLLGLARRTARKSRKCHSFAYYPSALSFAGSSVIFVFGPHALSPPGLDW